MIYIKIHIILKKKQKKLFLIFYSRMTMYSDKYKCACGGLKQLFTNSLLLFPFFDSFLFMERMDLVISNR